MVEQPAHLPEILLWRAERQPDAVAYEFLDDDNVVHALTYAGLARRAGAQAATLGAGNGGPVLVLCPSGLDYVVAVFGCFLAGRPVVPAYPVEAASADGDRLDGVIADAGVTVALTPSRGDSPGPAGLTRLPVEGAGARHPIGRVRTDAPAVLQYTSGSTGRPRGVQVSHDNLAANTRAMAERFELTGSSRAFSWLPPFHDMGLIGGILTPMTRGIPVRLMSPESFLKSPLRWLRQISESGTTVSGGPNFAYDLCLRRARGLDRLDGIDLSRWNVAFSGAEPVRRATMIAFAERFAPAGFDPSAFMPCYGLAEATLMVTAGRWAGAETAPADAAVDCGTPVPGQQLRIVDPETGRPVSAGAEGEIWIAGPHVTSGYWNRGDDELFGEIDGVRMLRTGDLGLLRDGALVVTGRRKDVIIHRGVNYHAADLEDAAVRELGAAAGVAAAFQTGPSHGSRTVLLIEYRGTPPPSTADQVKAAVLRRSGLLLDEVLAVPPRGIPRTSSGKIRRGRARELFERGDYGSPPVVLRTRTTALLTQVICGVTAGVCDVPACEPGQSLSALGVDSLRAAEAAAVLEEAVGLRVPLDLLVGRSSPQGVADALVSRWSAERPLAEVHERVAALTTQPEEA
jgi:acyl-CoA synthetase (AMP-forming)/AMP-acid ligase II